MKKRIFSVLLTLVMLLSLLPTTALAADTYTVTVNNGTGSGNYAKDASVTVTADAAPEGKTFKEWQIEGLSITASPSNPLTFDMPANNVTLTATYVDEGGLIESASATITVPVAGATPSDCTVVSDEASKYTATVVKWEHNVPGATTILGEDDRFIRGEDYRVYVRFAAKPGYEFDSSANYKINGTKVYAPDSTDTSVLRTEFNDVNEIIDNVKIKGVIAPVADAAPDTSGITSDTEGVNITSAEWKDQWGTDSAVTFEAGKKYKLVIKYSLDTHYKVADGAEVTFNISDNITDIKLVTKVPRSISMMYEVPVAAATTYTVTFKAGGGSGTMDPVTVEAGEYTLPECTFSNEGYEFKAWAYNSNVGEQLQPGTKITIRGDIRLYAVWQAKSYTITAVSEDENKGTVTGGGTYEYGTTIRLAATPKEGYVFEGWYKDGVRETGSSSYKSILVSEDAAYTAKFTKADDIITAANAVIDAPAAGANPDMTPEVPEADKDKYTVTFYKWYDSSYNEMSAGDTFEGGKEYELRVVFEAKEGYKFGGTTFTVNGEATEDFTDENPYSVTRRKIQFQVPAAASYPVTIIGGTFATSSASSGNYAPDSVIGITANAPETGKQFKEWVSDEVSFEDATATTTSFRMPAKAVTITATYEDIPATTYTVSFAANGGTGTMADKTGIFGEYTLPANEFTAPSGKRFKAWEVDGVEKAAHEKITVTADTIVTAVWEDIPAPTEYDITVTGGTASANKAVAGTEITLTVDESAISAGKVFDKWKVVSGGVTITDGKFTMPANAVEIKATYKDAPVIPVTYTITYTDGVVGKEIFADVVFTDVEEGSATPTISNPTRSGYTFTGWTPAVAATVTGDQTYTATWDKNSTGGGVVIPTVFPVTVKESDNGEVEASAKYAVPGSTVKLTVTPDEGYELDTLIVKSGSKFIDVTEKNGKYQFVMPFGSATVTATFKKIETPVVPVVPTFDDVAEDTYYFDAVEWAVKEGITSGTTASTFSPDMTCTRAQAVTFLWRAAGSPELKSNVMPFEDVAAEAYYYKAVLWAVENGITKGTSETTFSPDADCTRAQIVTFLWRAQKSPAADSVNPFTDVAADAYYVDAVLWAVEEKVTKGTSETTFSPDADCTRAQIVTFLYRALNEQ